MKERLRASLQALTAGGRRAVLGRFLRLGIAVLCAWALLELPLSPGSVPRPRTAHGISLDAVALLMAVILARMWRPRALPLLGSALSMAGGAFWSLLVVFEMARSATLHATNNDLPLYDSVLLAHHLYVLGRDLYGLWATAAVVSLLLSPLLLWALGWVLLARVEAAAGEHGRGPVSVAALGVLLGAGLVSEATAGGTRLLLPTAMDNAYRSATLWSEFRDEIEKGPSAELAKTPLPSKPDVVFYIVESYGQIVQSDPEMNARWAPAVGSLQERVEAAGWHVVSGLSVAPVHGGRSWIADASLLLGIKVEHEATYEHLMTLTDTLPHLPRFFSEHDYTTVLVKPKDRERPGVRLENKFGFDKTVFAVDLDYKGPYFGWGEIPDQYTLDRVEEEVMAPLQEPVFAFFHLVTSHMPWRPAPPLVHDWRDWQTREGVRQPVFMERTMEGELRMRISRWKRVMREDRMQRPTSEDQHLLYVDNVLYDVESVVQRLEKGVREPRLMIVMGDHQPPLVAPGSGPEVIVHVMSTDERWLQAFRERGFVDGMVPGPWPAGVLHRDLFPVLVQALSAP